MELSEKKIKQEISQLFGKKLVKAYYEWNISDREKYTTNIYY